jgi:hypothetical protein
MPNIVAEGTSYIRDDLSWASCEKSKGVYALDPQDASWIDAANVAGLKVVAILNANPIYPDKWDPTAAANFCAWLATTEAGKINAIEVVNAPEEEPRSAVEPVAVDEPAIVDETLNEAKPERPPRKKQASAKEEKRWKTSVQLSRRHEKIVNEFVMHYRMQGLRPVSVNTIILAALDVLKQTPQLDEVVHAIVVADKRVTRPN